MRNVTISLEEELARWVRVQAAERDMSMSSFVGGLLREYMELTRAYKKAMRRSLKRKASAISSGESYPGREELHDRSDLRR
jgi:hypothetical protein